MGTIAKDARTFAAPTVPVVPDEDERHYIGDAIDDPQWRELQEKLDYASDARFWAYRSLCSRPAHLSREEVRALQERYDETDRVYQHLYRESNELSYLLGIRRFR